VPHPEVSRAQQVRDAVIKTTKVPVPADMIATRGYSKLLPTSCNSSEEGRYKNRRVETWLK